MGYPITSVDFRGEERDVVIDVDGGYEPDTDSHVVEWHFLGLDADQHDALAMTDDEEENVYQQLLMHLHHD